MKKILLGILIGLFLHKSLETFYSYQWWNAEAQCRTGSHEKDMKCLYSKLGYIKYLSYGLGTIGYNFQGWGFNRP